MCANDFKLKFTLVFKQKVNRTHHSQLLTCVEIHYKSTVLSPAFSKNNSKVFLIFITVIHFIYMTENTDDNKPNKVQSLSILPSCRTQLSPVSSILCVTVACFAQLTRTKSRIHYVVQPPGPKRAYSSKHTQIRRRGGSLAGPTAAGDGSAEPSGGARSQRRSRRPRSVAGGGSLG